MPIICYNLPLFVFILSLESHKAILTGKYDKGNKTIVGLHRKDIDSLTFGSSDNLDAALNGEIRHHNLITTCLIS